MESTFVLRQLMPVDWVVLKQARLEALQESPHAFMSRYERERQWTESDWRRMFQDATWIIVREATDIVGIARSVVEPEQPQVRYLESIWVAPARRRCGAFRCMVHGLAEIERRSGVTDLLLWVMEDNHPARRAYRSLGFQPTGERQLLSSLGRLELKSRCRSGNDQRIEAALGIPANTSARPIRRISNPSGPRGSWLRACRGGCSPERSIAAIDRGRPATLR